MRSDGYALAYDCTRRWGDPQQATGPASRRAGGGAKQRLHALACVPRAQGGRRDRWSDTQDSSMRTRELYATRAVDPPRPSRPRACTYNP
eukprot:1336048-Prymnesium_polylepis.2